MTFNPQPKLNGTLLELRPLSPSDFDSLYAVASDPLMWEMHPAKDRYQLEVFKKFFEDAIQGGSAFLVSDKKKGTTIGCTRYYDLNLEKSEVCIGFTFLSRAYWGSAYNLEMKKLMVAHALKSVKNIIFHVGPKNLRSRRAVEKLGAVFVEYVEKLHPLPAGGWSDGVIYKLDEVSARKLIS